MAWGYGITQLEQFAGRIGGHLRHNGVQVKEIRVFRCGKASSHLYGPSYVDIRARKGDDREQRFRLVADGYWEPDSKWQTVFSGDFSLKDVRRVICERFDLVVPGRYQGKSMLDDIVDW